MPDRARATASPPTTPPTSPCWPSTASPTTACRSTGRASSRGEGRPTARPSSTTPTCCGRPRPRHRHLGVPAPLHAAGMVRRRPGRLPRRSGPSYHWARHVDWMGETFGDLVYGWQPINEPAGLRRARLPTGTIPPGRPGPRGVRQGPPSDAPGEPRGLAAAAQRGQAGRHHHGSVAVDRRCRAANPTSATLAEPTGPRSSTTIVHDAGSGPSATACSSVPGLPDEEIPDMAGSFDYIGFSYYFAVSVYADGTFRPLPRRCPGRAHGLRTVARGARPRDPPAGRRAAGPTCWWPSAGSVPTRTRSRTNGGSRCCGLARRGRPGHRRRRRRRGFFHWTAVDNYEWTRLRRAVRPLRPRPQAEGQRRPRRPGPRPRPEVEPALVAVRSAATRSRRGPTSPSELEVDERDGGAAAEDDDARRSATPASDAREHRAASDHAQRVDDRRGAPGRCASTAATISTQRAPVRPRDGGRRRSRAKLREHARRRRATEVGRGRRPTRSTTSAKVTASDAGHARGAGGDAVGRSRRGAAQPVDAQVQPVQPAPDHEGPAGAVPQAAEQHREHQVAVGPRPRRRGCRRAGCRGSRAARSTARCASAARTR